MAEVTVAVAGRSYRIGCEDGQESHLTRLAGMIDAEAWALSAGAPAQEGQLLLMAGLMIADRLTEATEALRRAEAALSQDRAEGAEAPARPAGQRGLFDGPDAEAALLEAVARLERVVAARDGG